MNAADLARLEIAKRAYRATEPNAAEVQRGVRRARLGLRRSKAPRRWLGKGLVMVVLAVGGLAYAKPHALGALLTHALTESRAPSRVASHGVGAAAPIIPPPFVRNSAAPVAASEITATAPVEAMGTALAPAAPTLAAPSAKAEPRRAAPSATAASGAPASGSSSTPTSTSAHSRSSAAASSLESGRVATSALSQASAGVASAHRTVSDWGRVGEALAQDDEAKALAALSELAESEDQRTRDKADMGRAQLFMANGSRDKACSIARALTNRRAGSRIERQAQALLKNCAR
jgi:hypothetical protein